MDTSPIQSKSPKRRDLRRHRRYAVDASVVQVSWLDKSGLMKFTRTRALNISEGGIALQLPEAVLPLLVRFQSDRFKVTGLGTVQYCRREGGKYIVGLEFTEDLHWRPPVEEVREPIPLCDPAVS
jgi:hypothetical protein